jgi:hypothetical protein
MKIASLQTAVGWQSWLDSINESAASMPNQGGNCSNPAGSVSLPLPRGDLVRSRAFNFSCGGISGKRAASVSNGYSVRYRPIPAGRIARLNRQLPTESGRSESQQLAASDQSGHSQLSQRQRIRNSSKRHLIKVCRFVASTKRNPGKRPIDSL